MAHMLITVAQAQALLAARKRHDKATKRRIFADIHREHPAIRSRKIVLFIENEANPLYRVIRDKRSKMPIDDGTVTPVAAPAKAPAKAPKVALSKASVTKTDTHQILMRVSIKGKKVQLGYASSDAAAAKIIAAARKVA